METVQEIILWFLATFGTVAVTFLGNLLAKLIKSKVANETVQQALLRANEAVWTAVQSVEQEYIKSLKAAKDPSSEGGASITQAEAKQARQLALQRAKSFLGRPGLELLGYVFGFGEGGLDSFLLSKIEAAVGTSSHPLTLPGSGTVRRACPEPVINTSALPGSTSQ